MNKKIKKLWVKALRSGKYKQTSGQLRDQNDNFCCLGVLCNLHAQAHPEIAAKEKHPTMYLGDTGVLPTEVREWASLDAMDGGMVTIGRKTTSLDAHNDNGRTFKQIANAIEKQL